MTDQTRDPRQPVVDTGQTEHEEAVADRQGNKGGGKKLPSSDPTPDESQRPTAEDDLEADKSNIRHDVDR